MIVSKFGFDVGWLQKGVSGLNNVILSSNEGLETKKDKIDKMTGIGTKFFQREILQKIEFEYNDQVQSYWKLNKYG